MELITTPYDFVWRVKNPQKYWADCLRKAKYVVYLGKHRLGLFCGVNRTFDDDMYYINYFNDDGEFDSVICRRNSEMTLRKEENSDNE